MAFWASMPEGAVFPKAFLWGAATSAYQVEGRPLADGAGPSIWHRFTHTPGRVADGDTGDVACDHYALWAGDVALMSRLGLNAYRFSISWSRVLPGGTGAVNEKGLDFYRHLVDALLAAGIQPFPTLYHWDLPAALDDRGGWVNPDIAGWFADYTRAAVRALGDRVTHWTTLNEPWVVADGGYYHGALAPGHASPFEAARASRNLLRAHAEGVRAFRAESRGLVGLVVNLEPKHPASDRPEDRAAAARDDAYFNRQYLDPVFLGTSPEELPALFGDAWQDLPARDLDAIREPIDFLGVNYYTRGVLRDGPLVRPTRAARVRMRASTETTTGWEVYPEGLFEILSWVRARYGPVPLYVTENGSAFYDPPAAPGPVVEDPLRVDTLHAHLAEVARARAAGLDVRGYFAWSLLDNFEWNHGTSKRFGLVHVNFATLERTLKRSALAYADVIRNARVPGAVPEA